MAAVIPFAVPADDQFATQTPDELRALLANARTAMSEYADMDVDDASDDDVDTMHALTDLVKKTKAALGKPARQEKVAGAYAALADALGDDEEPADDDADSDATEEEPPAPPTAKPAAKKTAVPSVSTVASGRKPAVAEVPTEREAETGQPALKATLLAAAGAPGMRGGEEVSWLDVAKAIERNLISYSGLGTQVAPVQNGVAQIKIDYPEDLTASAGPESDMSEFIAHVVDERRLPGGSLLASVELAAKAAANSPDSLTAAGTGWCAPSTVLYNLFELETNDGMVDVPEMNVSRGGIKFTPGPDFTTIFGGAGYFDYTEAQIITGVTKPVMSVACPAFQDVRLDAVGTAIQADLLTLRGYPELTSRFARGAMVAHNHRVNAKVLNAMQLGSTVVPQTAVATSAWLLDTSILSLFLATLSMGITDYKYRQRMRRDATLEVIAPYWALSMLQTDLERRAFIDGEETPQFAVTLATINRWAAARNARVQWVYDWQDALYWGLYATGAAPAHTQFGADPASATLAVNEWNSSFNIMVYAAGTWVRGNADVINLDTVYDSTLLAQNKATQLFAEQGILVAKTGFDSRIYKVGNGKSNAVGTTFAPQTFVGP